MLSLVWILLHLKADLELTSHEWVKAHQSIGMTQLSMHRSG